MLPQGREVGCAGLPAAMFHAQTRLFGSLCSLRMTELEKRHHGKKSINYPKDYNISALSSMSQPNPPIPNSVRLGMLLFVALPCLPGVIFLLSGVLCDPHLRARDVSAAGQVRYARAWEQTRELYLAGGFVLLAGTACAGGVVWKIARPGPPYEDEDGKEEAKKEERT